MSTRKDAKVKGEESLYTSANTSVIDLDSTNCDSVIILDDSTIPLDNAAFDSTYLAGGDTNMNPMRSFKTPPRVVSNSKDFITHEMVTSTPAPKPPVNFAPTQPSVPSPKPPATPQEKPGTPASPGSNGKRKRDESPDSSISKEDEAFDETGYSGDESTEDQSINKSLPPGFAHSSEKSSETHEETCNTVIDMTFDVNVNTTGKATDEKPESNDQEVGAYDEHTGMHLPVTVTLLTTPQGGRVYVVGTAHFSRESQDDVSKMIQAVRPHIVCVELCKTRTNILQLDEQTILEEAKNINFEKIRMSIHQMGLVNGLMYILLLNMSAHLTKQLGMAPGGEFRRAINEVKQLQTNCVIHLSDRPLNVTIQRALRSLSWWQTIKLSWHLIMNKEPITKEEVERCKKRDLLEEMLKEMAGEFPQLGTVFVQERDVYLAYSLQLAAESEVENAGADPTRVVAVVGIGHVPGIVQNWGKVTKGDIPPLLHIPPPSRSSIVLKLTLKASLFGLAVWVVARYAPRPDISRFVKLR